MNSTSPLRHGSIALCGALTFFLAVSSSVFAGGKKENKQPTQDTQEKTVIASTSWVAAIARAGGARNVRILAPVDLRHPPEYELKPSDLTAVGKADLIIYAGWEMFAQKLAETAGGAQVQIITVNTANTPDALKAEARKVAEILGTMEAFEAWAKTFDPFAEDLRREILAAYPGPRAVVQRMQTPFAQWLGFEIAGEYGPAEPSPAVILELVRTGPALVIDNYHGPSGFPIAEAADAPYAELLNFPGKDGTETLEDLFRYNARVLINAAPK
ncbi:MAG: ABC transporter substrate-binding protein [Treponema sp.]|nr:ABC transporter substrate-binding protein [Treponema sp.]